MNPKTLRILSLNLAFQLPKNRPLLRPWVQVWKPDLLVLLETLPDDFSRLHDLFPWKMGYPDPEMKGFGTEILSRFPIKSGIVLDPAADIPQVMARVDSPMGDLEVWGVHLRPTIPNRRPDRVAMSFVQRAAQIRVLSEKGGMGGLPTLLAGDFNLTPNMPGLRKLRKKYRHAHLQLGTLRPTYQYFLPLTLDHMLLAGVKPVAGITVKAPFSDHDGLVLDFTLEGNGGSR